VPTFGGAVAQTGGRWASGCFPIKQYGTTSSGNMKPLACAAKSGEDAMLTFQLVGAAFLLLCLAPLLARDPRVRR